jgi:hypothetical protein
MSHYHSFEKAKDYSTLYTLEASDELIVKQQEDGMLGYISISDLQTTLDVNGLATDTALTAVSASVANVVTMLGVSGSSATQAKFFSTDNGNGTNYKVGDDVWIGDINQPNVMQVAGVQNATVGYIQFGSGSNMPKIGGNGANRLNLSNIPVYADKTAAVAGGLIAGDVYRTGDNLCIVF